MSMLMDERWMMKKTQYIYIFQISVVTSEN